MYFEYWTPVLICALVSFAAGLILCIPYGLKSKHTAFDLNQTAGRLDKQKRCSMQNMNTIEGRITKLKSEMLKEIWERYKTDADNLFGGEHAPEPKVYYTYEDVFEIPCHEKILTVLQFIFPSFIVLSIISPLALLFFSYAEITPERVRACLAAACIGAIVVVVFYIITFICIKSIKQKNTAVLSHFNRTISALLPIINQSTQAALLLRASQQNTEAFRETAKIIADKIDDFALNGITPVVTEAFTKSIEKHISPGMQGLQKALFDLSNAVVNQQENGMRALAVAFADSLNNSIAKQIKTMSADMEALCINLGSFNLKTNENISLLLDTLSANSSVLNETAEISRSIVLHQEKTTQNIGEMSSALIRVEQVMDKIEQRDMDVFTGINASYDQIWGMQKLLDEQLKAAEATSKSTAEAINGTSSVISASVQSLIASADETSARTYNLISEKLVETLDRSSAANADSNKMICDTVQSLIASSNETGERTYNLISEKLVETLEETNAANANTCKTISDTVELLISETGKTVNGSFDRISVELTDLFSQTNASNASTFERISQSVENLTLSVGETVNDVFARNSSQLMEVLNDTVRTNKETSQKLALTMESLAQAGTDQYEKAARAAAQLLENVVIEMNKAMDGVGHEIADSIRAASIGSAEIVNRLAEKTAQLKNEYDTYFNRIETQSSTSLSEMEYRVQNVFARFSNDASNVMDRLEGNISKAIELFEGNTAMLLQSLEEQSRSIGLYAKDLNIDVASLTGTLRESVGIFTEHLQNSTHKTFAEFDEGLAEVSARLANTVESIRESIENLPNVIRLNQ